MEYFVYNLSEADISLPQLVDICSNGPQNLNMAKVGLNISIDI